jgi:hypothetical protein
MPTSKPCVLPWIAVLLLAACDARRDRMADVPGVRGAALQAVDDVDCGLLRERAHEDPALLVREYARYDALGHFLVPSAWFDGAVLCPGHVPAADSVDVIARYFIEPALVDADTALVRVRYERLGALPGGAVGTDAFVSAPAELTHEFTLAETTWGWRIVQPPPRRMVLDDAVGVVAGPAQRPAGTGGGSR